MRVKSKLAKYDNQRGGKVVLVSAESKRIFRIHLGLFLAELMCIPAFIFETYRAMQGNLLSWAYVFEWPILGIYSVYMWDRMLREERGQGPRFMRKNASVLPAAGPTEPDPELEAWNAYLAELHRQDPQPGA